MKHDLSNDVVIKTLRKMANNLGPKGTQKGQLPPELRHQWSALHTAANRLEQEETAMKLTKQLTETLSGLIRLSEIED